MRARKTEGKKGGSREFKEESELKRFIRSIAKEKAGGKV